MIVTILVILIIILIILLIMCYYKYRDVCNKLNETKDMEQYYRNKLSMIEYHYRNYKEGDNIFTVMRRISDILQNFPCGGSEWKNL